MVLPHQELENPVSSRNSMDIGYRGDAGRHQIAAFAMRLLARRSENSDAENAERRTVCRGRVWWAAVRTPCGCGIGWRKVGRSIQDDGAAFDYRHLRNTLSRSVKTFLCDAIRLTRMRHHYRTHGLKTWMINGGMIVSHSGHRVRRLIAVALTFRQRVAFAHEGA